MEASFFQPRSKLGVVLIGIFLGPAALMLWMGKGKAAAIYLLAALVISVLFFVPVALGFITPISIASLSPSDIFGFALLPLALIGIVHAMGIRNTPVSRPWHSRWYIALPSIPLAVIAIAYVIRIFFFQPFSIPAGSMIPSLVIDDHVFVSKPSYGYSPYAFPWNIVGIVNRTPGRVPERGEIVVFRHPKNTNIDYVKRLIGLPGDRVQMRDGVLHINGNAVTLIPINSADIPCHDEFGPCHYFRETLPNGRSYVINDMESDGVADNTEEYLVPESHYFMLGDNRDNSQDSRFPNAIGYVPFENLIGPVSIIFWNARGQMIDDRLEGYPNAE